MEDRWILEDLPVFWTQARGDVNLIVFSNHLELGVEGGGAVVEYYLYINCLLGCSHF